MDDGFMTISERTFAFIDWTQRPSSGRRGCARHAGRLASAGRRGALGAAAVILTDDSGAVLTVWFYAYQAIPNVLSAIVGVTALARTWWAIRTHERPQLPAREASPGLRRKEQL